MTDPFVARSNSVDSTASKQSRGFTRPPTAIPIPGQKLTAQQKKKAKREEKKKLKREGKMKAEGEPLPPIPEEVVKPKQESGKGKVVNADKFERCHPVRTLLAVSSSALAY